MSYHYNPLEPSLLEKSVGVGSFLAITLELFGLFLFFCIVYTLLSNAIKLITAQKSTSVTLLV